ncbi:MAG: NADH-quinone oxidoreductase subunit N [Breznakibacter sp.]
MSFQGIMLMGHELMMALAIVVLLIFEIFKSDKRRASALPLSILLVMASMAVAVAGPSEGKLFGGMYQTDALRVAVKLILDLGVLLTFFQTRGWISKHDNHDRVTEFYILMLSSLIGMSFMVSAGDFLMLYLGLELATMPLCALAAFDKYKRVSAEAGVKYIFSSAMSTAILLFGVSLIYATTGSIYFDTIAQNIQPDTLTLLGMVFILTGLGFKISLVPFHLWTADVYEGSPIAITTFLSVVSKGAAVFVFTWVLYNVFGKSSDLWRHILVILSIATMTVGNLFAIRQENFKRFLAFSSIAQAGFILLGVLGEGSFGMGIVVFFLLVYVFTNIAAFSVVAAVADFSGKENISDYNGFYKTNPKLTLVLMLALFSLAGIPPVAGFFGKLFLFGAAASKGFYWLIFVAVLNATISLYYYLKPVRAMFIEKNDAPIATFKTDGYLRTGIIACVVGIFATGFASVVFEYILSIS